MAELVLVRHAQASFGADDYDKLSELGWRQSRWLGEYFAERGIAFDRVVRGSLRRHAETIAGIGSVVLWIVDWITPPKPPVKVTPGSMRAEPVPAKE